MKIFAERIAEKRKKIENLNEDNPKEQARINKLYKDIKELEKVEVIKDLIKSISPNKVSLKVTDHIT